MIMNKCKCVHVLYKFSFIAHCRNSTRYKSLKKQNRKEGILGKQSLRTYNIQTQSNFLQFTWVQTCGETSSVFLFAQRSFIPRMCAGVHMCAGYNNISSKNPSRHEGQVLGLVPYCCFRPYVVPVSLLVFCFIR